MFVAGERSQQNMELKQKLEAQGWVFPLAVKPGESAPTREQEIPFKTAMKVVVFGEGVGKKFVRPVQFVCVIVCLCRLSGGGVLERLH